jgi:mRNA interferase MazF
MDRGQIVLAPFLYSDLVGMKRRPACVVSSAAYNRGPDVILAMVTSRTTRLQAPTLGDAVVKDWQAAGLRVPSVIRAGRLLVLEQRLIQFALGRLTSSDLALVD